MFGWGRPKPPLNASEKAWTETRMQRLVQHVGSDDWLRLRVQLPGDPFFTQFAEMRHDMRKFAEHLRNLLPGPLQCTSLPDSITTASTNSGEACGGCGSSNSHAESHPERSDCDDDFQATIAQALFELCLAALAERKFPSSSHADLALTADLASVVAGFGAFSANAALRRRSLPIRVWGYALALQCWVRNEADDPWRACLDADPLMHYSAGREYLRRNGETLFARNTLVSPRERASTHMLADQLRDRSPSRRIAALWELEEQKAASAIPRILDCLHDRDVHVRAAAVAALGAIGVASPEVMERLADSLHDSQDSVRAAAASAAGRLGNLSEDMLLELAETVCDGSPSVSAAAVEAVAQLGPPARVAAPALLRTLRAALVTCHDDRAIRAIKAIDAVVPDARASIMESLDSEQDLRHAAMDLLGQIHLKATAPADGV